MTLKSNFLYNSILLVSQYIFPIIIYPYISRILGVDKIGAISWVDGTLNYFIIFTMLGLTLTGVREVAKRKDNIKELSEVFIELLFIHSVTTLIITIIYIIVVMNNDKLNQYKDLYYIGISKLVFNVLLVEWFFKGIENFKFITQRSLIIKVLYIISIFVFVREKIDLQSYYMLTCGVVILNALVNFWYAFKFVSFKINKFNPVRHLKSYFTIGFYLILTSMYTTFNTIYLGLISTDEAVGSYTTALKLYTIILGLFSALNTVLMPKLSVLIERKKYDSFNELISKSLNYVITLSFPIIICSVMLAPQIIYLLSGKGFEKSILCFRIVIPLVLFVGIAQILSNQILMSIKKDTFLAYVSISGAIIGIILNFMLVPKYCEIGTSLVVLCSEIIVTIVLYIICYNLTGIKIDFSNLACHLFFSIPYVLICSLVTKQIDVPLLSIVASFLLSCIYFIISQVYFIKNGLITCEISKIKNLY